LTSDHPSKHLSLANSWSKLGPVNFSLVELWRGLGYGKPWEAQTCSKPNLPKQKLVDFGSNNARVRAVYGSLCVGSETWLEIGPSLDSHTRITALFNWELGTSMALACKAKDHLKGRQHFL
jgi:hypothetical protein